MTPELQPEIASKVLSADLHNIVATVSNGGVLSTAARELIQRHLADGTLPEDLHRARRAALLRRWANGEKLNEDQMQEIQPYLAEAPAPSPPAEKVPSPVVTRERYQHSLDHYAKIIGRYPRILKGWIAHGRYIDIKKKIPRETPDFPPFDDLPEMEAWWGRCMTNKCPDCLKQFSQGTGSTTGQSDRSADGKTGADGAPPPGKEPEFEYMPELQGASDDAEEAGLALLRSMVKTGIEEMKTARKLKDFKRYRAARAQLKEDMEELRQWVKSHMDSQIKRGEFMRARVLTPVFVSIFGITAQSFTNALLSLAAQLAPQMPERDRRELVMPLRDRVIGHVKKTRFAAAWEASSHAA